MKQTQIHSFSLIVLGLLTMLTSCEYIIFSNFEECDRGIYVNLYEQTECASVPSYPNHITDATFFVFDVDNKLVVIHEEKAITLAEDKEFLISLRKKGLYTVVAWAHNGDMLMYDFSETKKGETTPEDLYITLKNGADLSGHRLYVGTSELLTVGEDFNLFVHTKLNIREITNRIKIKISGFVKANDYKLELLSGNHKYEYGGKVLHSEPFYSYDTNTEYTDSTLTANFTILQVDGYYHSYINIADAHTGAKVPFDQETLAGMHDFNLLGAILIAKGRDYPYYREHMNPRCINDFEIEVKTRVCDCPSTYTAVGLIINNWAFHSYDADF